MMKINVLIACTLLFSSFPANVCADDFSISAGAGGLAGYTFSRYSLKGGEVKSTQNMDRFDYAGFIFFDATYAELTVMYKGGNSSYRENMIHTGTSLTDSTGTGSETSIGFSLLGKYPFRINERLTWFPLIGVEYQIALIQRRKPDGGLVYDRSKGQLIEDQDKNGNPYSLSAWNSLWIDIGAGLDCHLIGSLFLRGELLFAFRLPTAYEMGALEVVKNPPMNVQSPKLAGLTGSPMLKIAIAYQF